MNYIIEANIGIVFLYGVYALLLRNETDFRKQRMFLVGSLLCALIFPFIEVSAWFDTPVETTGLTLIMLPEFNNLAPNMSNWSTGEVLMTIYLSVMLLIAAPLLFHAGRLYQSVKQARGRYRDDFYVIESNENTPSWSFFKTIYIGRSNELAEDEKDLVMEHEMLHGRLWHSADMLLTTALCIIFWFNPFVWIYRRTIAKVHEFEVDALVAEQHGATGYCVLLAKTALAGNGFPLAHHFNQSFILKRINMINMTRKNVSGWKIAAVLMTITIYFFVVGCNEQVSNENETKTPVLKLEATDEVFTVVENNATPIGGMTSFYEKLGEQLEYPDQARKMGIEGKVFVEFVILPDGNLTQFKVLKGIGAGCDAEALRVMSKMGKWNAPMHEGKPVAQRLVIPINFKLQ